jgi:hypothetical protein
MNPNNQQQQRKPMLQMPSIKRVSEEDEYAQSYVAMLNVLRRYFDLTGDPFIKPIIEKAERALGRSR